MGDRANGWITVGHRYPPPPTCGLESDVDQEMREREIIAAWDNDEQWPSVHKPPIGVTDAKRFDARLVLLDYLGGGAFGRVDKVMHGSICLARKRITRRRGITIEDLRQEGLTMRKLDHRHVVKLVAAYMPRPHELCLLIWPAAVCDLDALLVDLDQLRLGAGDRDEILARLKALELNDLSVIEPSLETQTTDSNAKCPFDFLRGVIGCIARGLAHCHLNDVRHLDIKPSNILLKAGRVYLADFGISKDVSGQDQTTIDGNPGTEKWRAPELYGEDSSSMQLSDIYSLGLVFLNIATVLYKVRLSEFDDALLYSPDLPRLEKLAIREEKLKKLLETLTAHALVTPPFMFTHEGLETVRPRPLVGLIARLTSPVPRNRLPADKVDEKLSMLGGIHQIYHSGCCKRPISWVEDKWDKKFSALAGLKIENEALKRKIAEFQGRDDTYEQRLENARKAHEHDVSKLQAMLKEAEERCRVLSEQSQGQGHWQGQGNMNNWKKSLGREQHERQGSNHVVKLEGSVTYRLSGAGVGLGLSKVQTHPSSIPKRPSIGPSSLSSPRVSSFDMHHRTPPGSAQAARKFAQGMNTPPPPTPTTTTTTATITTKTAAAAARIRADSSAGAAEATVPSSPGIMSRSHSGNSTTGHHLRSRGSGSKLPLPVTPISRSQTPNLNREQSLTDSSMTSSVFSQQSMETLPTPGMDSPAPGRRTTTTTTTTTPATPVTPATPGAAAEDGATRLWGRLPAADERRRRRPSSPSRSSSPDLTFSPSVLPSPRLPRRSEAVDSYDTNATARPKVPALLPSKSWAEIAAKENRPTTVR